MKNLNKSKCLLLSFLLTQLFLKSFAQSSSEPIDLHLRSHHHGLLVKHKPDFTKKKHLRSALYKDRYFVLLKFEDLLNDSQRSQLKDMGIHIRDYIPGSSYVVSVPKNIWNSVISAPWYSINGWDYLRLSMGLEHIDLLHSVDKLSHQLYLQVRALPEYSLDVTVSIHVDVPLTEAYYDLKNRGFTVSDQLIMESHELKIRIRNPKLGSLAEIPYVRFVNTQPQPLDISDVVGESLNGKAFHGTGFAGSIHGYDFVPYEGDGITVAVDDLGIFNHEDFRGRFTDNTSNIEESAFQSHGAMATGVLAGAGNLDPNSIGIAPGANIQYFSDPNISNLPINNAIANFNDHNISVTNMSLSEHLDEYLYPGNYTEVSSQLDDVAILEPRIARFMSAGNEGNDENFSLIEDRDGNDTHYGNITGAMKSAKNVITVGNVSNLRILETNSSTGPTLDGRIKPDITAMGIGQTSTAPFNSYQGASGTSAASPTAAGIGALLQQAYRDKYSELPNFALLKGIMLNTADDAGRPGPDFEFGYGIINARRAFEVIKGGTFFSGAYDGNIQYHDIDIPENISQIKIMLIWLDPGAAPQSTKALVNDLNMSLTVGETEYLPWVLTSGSTTFDDEGNKINGPNLNEVTRPARRGNDNLNNMEQITLSREEYLAGPSHTLSIDGILPNGGSQEYFIVYSFVYDELTLTYPNGGERLVPNTIETIHWDIPNNPDIEDITLEYRIGDNGSWIEIATGIPADQQYYQWRVPKNLIGRVKIRIKNATYSDESDKEFHILGIPGNLTIEKTGERSAVFSWDPVKGATSYEVFRIGDKYMEDFRRTTQTSVEIRNLSENHSNWYSVRAKVKEQRIVGKRAIAIEYRHAPGTIWYVNNDANSGNGGSSWSDAFSDLQDAFDAAAYGDQIWVASGTYRPSRIREEDRDKDDASWRKRFEMRSGLKLYGGFAGNESSVEERMFDEERNGVRQLTNETILSGHLDNDSIGDVYTVMLSINVNSSALLDGFTIIGGNSYGNGGLNRESGGGLYYNHSQMRTQNCKFEGNRARIDGGAVHITDYSDVVFRNCAFDGNYTDGTGGAIDISSNSTVLIENSHFTINKAGVNGGAIYCNDSGLTILNATFMDNTADSGGGTLHKRNYPLPHRKYAFH